MTTKTVVYKNKYSTKLEFVDKTIDLVPKGEGFGCKSDEILVKIVASALNPIDVLLKGFAWPIFNHLYSDFSLCIDYSGVVVDIGEKAKQKYNFSIGDKVCGQTRGYKKTLTEYVNFEASQGKLWNMIKVPKGLTMMEAASFPLVYSTAASMFEACVVPKDGKVLINGASTSVGKYLISILKAKSEVKEIFGICSSNSAPIVKALGVDEVIDYKVVPDIKIAVLEHCSDKKFDVYFDCAGNTKLMNGLSDFIVKKGSAVFVSGGGKTDLTHSNPMFEQMTFGYIKTIIKSKMGMIPVKVYPIMAELSVGFEYIDELNEAGKFKPVIDKVYEFDQSQEAYECLIHGRNNGKIVIKVSDE